MTEHALARLFADPDFARLVEPAFQEAVVSALSRIENMVADLWQNQQAMPLLTAQKLAQRFGAEADLFLDPGRIAPFLETKANEYAELKARLDAPTNEDDPGVQRLRHAARLLIDEGAFDEADARLAEAEALDEAMEREEEERLARRKQSRARSRAERGDLARMRTSYREAGEHYAAAANIVVADTAAAWAHQLRRAGALWRPRTRVRRQRRAGRGDRALPRHRAASGTARRAAGRLGDDAEQPRQRAHDARRAGERHGAAGGGRRRLSRRAGGVDARARAAGLGGDAEQSRRRARRRSASGRAARRGWRRRSPPIARRWRSGRASACRSTGR